jgi:hypothetical protein
MPKAATKDTALPIERLCELFEYDAASGAVTNGSVRRGRAKFGAVAGSIDKYGYRMIIVGGLVYPAHRLVWYLYYGRWPIGQIDHINMDFTDNRIVNLREATMTQQRANQKVRRDSKTQSKGVQITAEGNYRARIKRNGIVRRLGVFKTPQEAHAAYIAAAKGLFGEFARP